MKISFDTEVKTNLTWLKVSGILLFLCGLLVFSHLFFTYESVPIIPFLFVGIITLIHSFMFWFKKYLGFFLHVSAAAIYLGLALLFGYSTKNNILGYVQITFIILILSYGTMGIFRIYISISQSLKKGWIWTFYCGLFNFVFAGLMFWNFFNLSYFNLILLATSVDIMATGVALLALGLEN